MNKGGKRATAAQTKPVRGMFAGIRPYLLSSVALVSLAQVATVHAQTPVAPASQAANVSFHISPGSLDQALTAFGAQSGLQVIYGSSLSAGKTSSGLTGTMPPDAALQRLLADTGLIAQPTGARAVTLEQAQADASGATDLPAVQVRASSPQSPTGPGVGYVATTTRTGTKSDTPIIEVPQSITTVTRKQMNDQGVQSVRQALNYSAGVDSNKNGLSGDAFEQIYGRGFLMQEYLDGLVLPQNAYNVLSVDPYDLERIEILHGPASVLYGQAYPAGIVNLTSKTPTDTPEHEVFLQGGWPKQIGGGFDIGGPVAGSDKLFYRLVGSALDGDTQVDHVDKKRISIAPSVTWKPDADTSFTLLGRYQYDPAAGYYNNLPALGTLWSNPGGQIPTALDPGDPSYQKYSRTEASIGYLFDHRFNDVWSVHQNLRYTYDDSSLENVFAYGLVNGNELQRYAFANYTSLNQFTVDTNVNAKFSTGPLVHNVTAGVDYQRIFYKERYGNNFDEPNLDIFAPVYGGINPVTDFTIDTELQTQFGAYAQDQMRLGHFAFLLGGRNDWAKTSADGEVGAVSGSQSDSKFTWRAGVVYLFDNGIAPYFSYATSFLPQIGTDAEGNTFQPTTGQQYEVGLKYQPPGYNSFITAALFNLTEQNALTADPNNSNFETQTGEIRSRGLELEGHASLANNLDLVLTYTYLDNVVTKGDTLEQATAYTNNVGKTPAGMPSNMASAWVNYVLPWEQVQGLSLGGGVRYIGSTYGDNENSFSLHAVTLLDATISYDLSHFGGHFDGLKFQLNSSNLLNTTYVASCTSSTACAYGLKRTVIGSLKYDW